MDANGNVTTGDYDLVPLLEKFIQAHPDFSYRGARAVLGVTGYEGVLGYRTKPSYETTIGTERYQKEVADAKAVVQCLKEHGWILASHSYGHPAYGNISADRVATDSTKWENTCQNIIGETDILLYPHGSDIAGIGYYNFDNAKFKALYEDGYRYFFNVDSNVAWQQKGDNYLRGGRRNLDGYRMYHDPELLDDLFDAHAVLDKKRPLPVPSL
jgi:peptidoglycan/xylan/chitin deacetylase (PgdA/CDA1 family)